VAKRLPRTAHRCFEHRCSNTRVHNRLERNLNFEDLPTSRSVVSSASRCCRARRTLSMADYRLLGEPLQQPDLRVSEGLAFSAVDSDERPTRCPPCAGKRGRVLRLHCRQIEKARLVCGGMFLASTIICARASAEQGTHTPRDCARCRHRYWIAPLAAISKRASP